MPFSRRDFLKLLSLTPLVLAADRLPAAPRRADDPAAGQPNVIILVFDAFSGPHLSLYGYPRRTTPNIERFAARANVYHSHYAGGTFTSSGTASLLTGMLPWSHRALQFGSLIDRRLLERNMFTAVGGLRFRQTYAQNPWAANLLRQVQKDIDEILISNSFNLTANLISRRFFLKDPIAAYAAVDTAAVNGAPMSASTALAALANLEIGAADTYFSTLYAKRYPLGLPTIGNGAFDVFTLEDVFEGLFHSISGLPASSTLGYYHIFPPHFPVRPTSEFVGRFDDGWAPVAKPAHPLSDGVAEDVLVEERKHYDEYIASIDAEFGRLIDRLEAAGVLEHTHIILTSDHGEMHERGQLWHGKALMYESLIHLPLIVYSPGQTQRRDIYTATSNVDLLPTVLSLSGLDLPGWAEGRILPGFGGEARTGQPVLVVDAKTESSFGLLNKVSLAMIRSNYKLIYHNYPDYPDHFELYDLQADPEELINLYSETDPTARDMKAQLLASLAEANRPYRGASVDD